MAINNFNRVISIKFFPQDTNGNKIPIEDFTKTIRCPTYGRKPNIEITGLQTTDECIPSFNLKIKNLYFEDIKNQYPFIEVELGYAKSTVTIEGTIFYSFTESPGPESVTVIQCLMGNSSAWLSKTVNLNLDKGFTLQNAINQIAMAVGLKSSLSMKTQSLVSTIAFQFTGKAKDAVQALKKCFSENLIIKSVQSELKVMLSNEANKQTFIHIYLLTTPPQLIGGENNIACATITTLCDFRITPGTKVIFNSNFYSTTMTASTTKAYTKMIVSTVNFHFSTTSGANEMTIQGQVL